MIARGNELQVVRAGFSGKLGDFFAGIGLVELALEPAGWTTVFANDCDRKKRDIYSQNFDDSRYVLCDVNKLHAEEVPDLDLAWASFPCIDISEAGHRRGMDGEQSSTFWGFYRVLQGMGERKPPLVVVENVRALLSGYQGRALERVVGALNSLGYRCDMFLIDAVHFVPQSRPRIFIVGGIEPPFEAITSVQGVSAVRPKRLIEFMLAHSDLRWGFLRFPEVPDRSSLTFSDIAEDLPEDSPSWWEEGKTSRLLSQMSPAHLERARALADLPTVRYVTAYRRIRSATTRAEVRFDGIAGCLRTPVGGSSRQIVIKLGRGRCKVRWMTAREYARLQGVPDSFRIDVPERQALYGFGDAVNVHVIRWLGEKVLNPLWERMCSAVDHGEEATRAAKATV